MDRISTLPNEILDLILERLPLIDKVRTSALSSIWRLRWTRLPSLIVDKNFYCSLNKGEGIRDKKLPLEHARVVQSVILQHCGCMREFSLFLPVYYMLCPTSVSIYHDAICSAVTNSSSSLERLILEGSDEDGLLLPPSVFSLLNLRHLEIRCFQFKPPSWFGGFPDLAIFMLASETATRSDTVQRFVSVCPKLESVSLELLHFWDDDIDLKAPQLRHLYVGGCFNDVFLSNVQNLDSVSLGCQFLRFRNEEDPPADTYRFLESATQLKHISLNGFFCELLGQCSVIRKLPTYRLMKTLELQNIVLDQADLLQCVLSLLASAPNLRKLELRMMITLRKEKALELHETMIEKYINADFEHLVRVDMCGIVGGKIQMKIIEWVLRFSPVLEIMHIKFHVEEGLELKLQEAITKFHRASTKAKIHFVPVNSCGR